LRKPKSGKSVSGIHAIFPASNERGNFRHERKTEGFDTGKFSLLYAGIHPQEDRDAANIWHERKKTTRLVFAKAVPARIDEQIRRFPEFAET
jgi:hypothetical protein